MAIPEPFKIGTVTIYNCDCLELLRSLPNKSFDLSLDDPPYGMSGRWIFKGSKKAGKSKFISYSQKEVEKINQWDILPQDEWFSEIKRGSKNQIIWGGNYMLEKLGSCRGPIIWNKLRHDFTLADGEMAWSSFDKPLRIVDCGASIRSSDRKNNAGERIHPNEKPVYLYRWVLERYAKPGHRILDTHLGSGTHAIACLMMGFELVACELSPEYYEKAIQKIKHWKSSHQEMFDKKDVSSISLKAGDMF
jgi:site-specific DNA-methyltransferase (adenine-specific)